jgi:tetratricopeptide (TPR) repeat protein
MAKQAVRDAEAKIGQSEKSADFLFAAELAVDGASEANGAPAEAVEEARALLTKARQAAREGRYELAATDAAVAEKIALGLVDQKRKARETLESVEKLVVGLRTAGVVVGSVQKSLDIGKALLDKGKVGAAIDVFNEAAQEAVALGTRYREVLNALSVATAAIDSLKSEGLASTEADLSLERAQAALQQGNYKLAASACEDAHRAAAMQRRFRDGLRSLIDETRERIKTLREAGVAYVNDAEEMVSKAEREFANGEYEATNEDLRIAGLLMGPPSEGKPKSGPTPP